jgi:hypothetical protein
VRGAAAANHRYRTIALGKGCKVIFLILATVVAAATAVIVRWVGQRSYAQVRVALLAVVLAAAVWLGGFALISRGWKDMDGWIDCTSCHGWHYTGALVFFVPPILTLFLLIGIATDRVRQAARSG